MLISSQYTSLAYITLDSFAAVSLSLVIKKTHILTCSPKKVFSSNNKLEHRLHKFEGKQISYNLQVSSITFLQYC